MKHDLGEQRQAIKQLAADLAKAGPYKDGTAENVRRKGLQLAESLEELLATAEGVCARERNGRQKIRRKARTWTQSVKAWRKLLR